MKMKSIAIMLDQINEVRLAKELTTWEEDFVKNCMKTYGEKKDTTMLSSKQVEMIETIHNRHFEL